MQQHSGELRCGVLRNWVDLRQTGIYLHGNLELVDITGFVVGLVDQSEEAAPPARVSKD